ncbi:MAG: hypothetical protein IPK03_07630 [Bacteroidetes bacterium]|nr:hypothetical protein [Bacteroidota bacterium]
MRLKDVIFKDSLVYGVTMNLSIISAIILTPQYTRTLAMSDYGIMDIFNTWNSLITNFLPVGMLTIIMIIYDDLKTKGRYAEISGNDLCLPHFYISPLFAHSICCPR